MASFERRRERRDRVMAVAAIGLVTLALFWPMALGLVQGELRFFEWDVPEQYWPDLVYLCDALHDGELPAWNPYDRAGYPYFADPQAAPYQPINWAICAVGGRTPHWGFAQLRVVLGFLLTGLFGLAWLRRVPCGEGQTRMPWSAATAGAALLMCAPFLRHNWELNLTSAFAFAPLVLYAIERVLQERRPLDGGLLALAVGMLAWTGSPPALWQASSFALLYGVVRGVTVLRAGAPLGRLGASVGVAVLLTLGFVGVVFAPGLELAAHSVQAGRSLASIAEGGLAPDDLVALVWPQPGNHLFVGWLPWLVAPLALGGRALPRFALAVLGLAVLLALGTETPAFELLFDWVPGVALFRLPHRYEAWMGPAAALLLAGGVARLEYAAWRVRRWKLGWLVPVALGGGVALAEGLAPLAALCGAIVLVRVFVEHTERGAFGLALALLVFVETSATLPPERHTRAGEHPGTDPSALALDDDIGRGRRYLDEFGVACRSGTRTRRRELRGYQDPLLLRSFERVMAHLHETPALLPQFGVRHTLQGPHFLHGWNRHFAPPPDALRAALDAEPIGPHATRIDGALPLAYWTSAMGRVTDRAAALQTVRALAPAPVAVLEEGRDATWSRPAHVEFVPATDWRSDRDALSFRVHAPEPGWVVVNEAHYPGWVAEVDGHAAPIERANGLVRAIPVPAGAHVVAMRFEPPSLRWRWALLASWLVFGGLAARAWRRRR